MNIENLTEEQKESLIKEYKAGIPVDRLQYRYGVLGLLIKVFMNNNNIEANLEPDISIFQDKTLVPVNDDINVIKKIDPIQIKGPAIRRLKSIKKKPKIIKPKRQRITPRSSPIRIKTSDQIRLQNISLDRIGFQKLSTQSIPPGLSRYFSINIINALKSLNYNLTNVLKVENEIKEENISALNVGGKLLLYSRAIGVPFDNESFRNYFIDIWNNTNLKNSELVSLFGFDLVTLLRISKKYGLEGRKSYRRPFLTKLVNQMKYYYNIKKYSTSIISNKLGYSEETVRKYLIDNGVTMRKSSTKNILTTHFVLKKDRGKAFFNAESMLRKIKQYSFEGLTIAQIAKKLNVTDKVVRMRMKALGIYDIYIKKYRKEPNKNLIQGQAFLDFKRDYLSGMHILDLVSKYNISRSTVYEVAKKNNLKRKKVN
jgi:hypothetical protein